MWADLTRSDDLSLLASLSSRTWYVEVLAGPVGEGAVSVMVGTGGATEALGGGGESAFSDVARRVLRRGGVEWRSSSALWPFPRLLGLGVESSTSAESSFLLFRAERRAERRGVGAGLSDCSDPSAG